MWCGHHTYLASQKGNVVMGALVKEYLGHKGRTCTILPSQYIWLDGLLVLIIVEFLLPRRGWGGVGVNTLRAIRDFNLTAPLGEANAMHPTQENKGGGRNLMRQCIYATSPSQVPTLPIITLQNYHSAIHAVAPLSVLLRVRGNNSLLVNDRNSNGCLLDFVTIQKVKGLDLRSSGAGAHPSLKTHGGALGKSPHLSHRAIVR